MRAIYDYIIYTDGGCECNPGGRGGYGAVIINNNTGEFTDISGAFVVPRIIAWKLWLS